MPQFINPAAVVAQAGFAPGQSLADLGCGSGFYVLPAAQIVGDAGRVYAVDVLEDKLSATASIAKHYGYKNVSVLKADLEKPLLAIEPGSCDGVILASILHEIESRENLLKNVYRVLKTGGRALLVEWKKELTPLGPAMEKRLSQGEAESLMGRMGLRKEKEIVADGYHYALVFVK